MRDDEKTFSVIVPIGPNFTNYQTFAKDIAQIDFPREKFEVILVLDAHVASPTAKKLSQILDSEGITSTLLENSGQSGPGIARNIGIDHAANSHILFLDTDDRFVPNVLNKIDQDESDSEIIFYNFKRLAKDHTDKTKNRKDLDFFASREKLIEGALKNQLEQECWQAAYKKDFLSSNSIKFNEGIFEDLRFHFLCLARMSSYSLIEDVLYEKIQTPGSVTEGISKEGISSYLTAWLEMAKSAAEELGFESENYLRIGIQNVVGQYAYRIIQLEESAERQFQLIDHLLKQVEEQSIIQNVSSARNKLPTLYSDTYSFLSAGPKSMNEIVAFVSERQKLEWSCGDIENSVFLAPNEIRTCCKRFFVDGKIAGDVVLDVKIESGVDAPRKITTSQVYEAKQSLKRRINIGNKNECSGCPYLELKNWESGKKKSFEIKYLSMEQHSICNLRCTYCDDKYYGGLNPDYDVTATLLDFHQSGVTSNLQTVVWGGGEPTLDPNFPKMLAGVRRVAPNCEHRFLSNSKRFSQEIYDSLNEGHSQLVTSMDAGSDSKYLEIRGRKGYSEVLENLRRYSEIANNSLVIKYIFTSENQETSELKQFVEDIARLNLTGNIFQISYDFKSEVIDKPGAKACLYLFDLLYQAGANYVYFDDLLLTRFQNGAKTGINAIIDEINLSGQMCSIGKPSDYKDIALFGAGDQAERMVKKFNLLERYPINSVVENRVNNTDKEFHGLRVQNLNSLTKSNSRVLLAGVQSVPQMLKSLRSLGIQNERIIRELLI